MADTQPYRPKKRGYETAGDMLRSMLPIVIIVLVFAAFCVPRGSQRDPRIDPSVDITSAAQAVDFEVVAPDGLSDEWVPTSSKLLRAGDAESGQPNGLSIGYISPAEDYALFTIRQGLRAEMLSAAVDPADVTKDPAGDPVEIAGREWTPITTSEGDGYVNVSGEGETAVVIVLSGTADAAELRELAGSLAPAAGR
ncbi:DUF4245 family protein [Epidermidibacterium keratini]|uniref:DUF4245 family protein n=1 Tax=Epidermidibacterium keratini TaxID=1891644 RepID=A0A7L4YLC8_9ACTN|nr:DUF4245 domain-containing protein [Epidermidibacterium keratini]QHB99682.1 DUF4245 family protein [Epidermidibacterium keratini]